MIDAEKYNLDIHRHIEKISKKKPIVKSNRFVPKHKDDKLHILYQKQKWFWKMILFSCKLQQFGSLGI